MVMPRKSINLDCCTCADGRYAEDLRPWPHENVCMYILYENTARTSGKSMGAGVRPQVATL